MKIVISTELKTRDDFGLFCNAHNLREAAEIGTHKGDFALQFLQKWKGYTLLLIDPYLPYCDFPWDRYPARETAIIRLAPYAAHAEFISIPSPEAARMIPPFWGLQFCYLDGAHDYASVKADIGAWWDRLDDVAVLAGHDFADHAGGILNLETLKGANGVVQALIEFAEPQNLTIYVVRECNGVPDSWYIFKGDHA